MTSQEDVVEVRTYPSRRVKAAKSGLGTKPAPDKLPPRMMETLILLCHGYTNREIGLVQSVGEETIKTRVGGLLAAFDARNRTHLAVLAVSSGLVVIEP